MHMVRLITVSAKNLCDCFCRFARECGPPCVNVAPNAVETFAVETSKPTTGSTSTTSSLTPAAPTSNFDLDLAIFLTVSAVLVATFLGMLVKTKCRPTGADLSRTFALIGQLLQLGEK